MWWVIYHLNKKKRNAATRQSENGLSTLNKATTGSVYSTNSVEFSTQLQRARCEPQWHDHRAAEVYLFFANPPEIDRCCPLGKAPKYAWAWTIFMSLMVIVSMGVIVVISMWDILSNPRAMATVFIVEGVAVFFLSFDLMIRFCTFWSVHLFWSDWMNWVELFSIIPFFFRLSLYYSGHYQIWMYIRVLNFLRLARLARDARRFPMTRVFLEALWRAGEGIRFLMASIFVLIVFFSMLLFYVASYQSARDPVTGMLFYDVGPMAGEPAFFQNMLDSLWFSMLLITGNAQNLPTSLANKLICMVIFFVALIVLAFPVTILGLAFAETFEAHNKRVEDKKAAKKASKTSVSGSGGGSIAASTFDLQKLSTIFPGASMGGINSPVKGKETTDARLPGEMGEKGPATDKIKKCLADVEMNIKVMRLQLENMENMRKVLKEALLCDSSSSVLNVGVSSCSSISANLPGDRVNVMTPLDESGADC